MASESPKWIALVLSLIAIVVSGLSWWESHRNRIIAEGVNRPILVVDSVTSDWKITGLVASKDIWGSFEVTTRNTGKVTALLTNHDATAKIEPGSQHCEILQQVSELEPTVDIASGTTFRFGQSIRLSPECKEGKFRFLLTIELKYRDATSGQEYSSVDLKEFTQPLKHG